MQSYQWIKGDYLGTVEVFDNNDGEWITFQSGRRISVEVFHEYLFDVTNGASPNQKRSFSGVKNVQFEQPEENYSEEMFNPIPKAVPINSSNSNNTNSSSYSFPGQPIQQETKPKLSPIQLLLTQSSKESIKLSLQVEVDVPRQSVYTLIKDAFDSAEVDVEILGALYSEINTIEFKEKIKKEIEEKIKLHYK